MELTPSLYAKFAPPLHHHDFITCIQKKIPLVVLTKIVMCNMHGMFINRPPFSTLEAEIHSHVQWRSLVGPPRTHGEQWQKKMNYSYRSPKLSNLSQQTKAYS